MRFKEPTKICKLCFKPIEEYTLSNVVNNFEVCSRCYEDIIPKFTKFKIDNIKALAVYDYDEKIQSLIYQLKGCFDIEIAELFLERFKRELRIRYWGYVIVPIPSYKQDDEIRGFNHVVELFKSLKIITLEILEKTQKFKQALNTKNERKDIKKYLSLKETPDLSHKKVLLVDDVYTTGSTMKAAIELIKTLNPKKIEVLVVSKTIFKPENAIKT